MQEEYPTIDTAALSANIANVQGQMAAAAQRAGRDPAEITLVAVSKTKPLDMVRVAYNAGVRHFGENRIQEAQTKIAAFSPPDLVWHMIGHLQSNKAIKATGLFGYIHSVDSWHLAELLNRYAEQAGKCQSIFLQVNVSGEASKEGVSSSEALDLARQLQRLQYLDVQGLMTIAPLVKQAEEVRPVFRALRQLRDRLRASVPELNWQHLSMGMTDDFPIAIEEGATIVRVGRAIFGERASKGAMQ